MSAPLKITEGELGEPLGALRTIQANLAGLGRSYATLASGVADWRPRRLHLIREMGRTTELTMIEVRLVRCSFRQVYLAQSLEYRSLYLTIARTPPEPADLLLSNTAKSPVLISYRLHGAKL